jgi:flagellin-specific chaperone FliS
MTKMYSANSYNVQAMFGGWTRIDMLLAIYDRAIAAAEAAETAKQSADQAQLVTKTIEIQKCILAIHGGLKPDEYDIAYDIARILNYALRLIEAKNFSSTAKLLGQLRDGFAAIRAEAIALEQQGKIPPVVETASFSAVV